MNKHIVKISIWMTFEEMDGTPEQTALIAMDMIDLAFAKYDEGFVGFYNLGMNVEECYEVEQDGE